VAANREVGKMFDGGLKPWHVIVLVIVLVALFGSKKLPDAARSIGKSMKAFKEEIKDPNTDSKEEPKKDN
jgi:sec-independent protein translocase protein TatA